MNDAITELQEQLQVFARERDWERFHTPKNLAMALAGEIGELVEIFQWLTPEESVEIMDGNRASDVEDELADAMIYLVRLADVLGVDLLGSCRSKIVRNEARFPRGTETGSNT